LENVQSTLQDLSLHENSQISNGTSTVDPKTNNEESKVTETKEKKIHKRAKKKKKEKELPQGQKKCTFCQKLFPEANGQIKNEQFYCIPCANKVRCDQCRKWFDSNLGKLDDQEGTWFCFKCWTKWEHSQRKYWTQRDPDKYMSSKMRKLEKDWSKGGSW